MAPETYRLAAVIDERREARGMSLRDLADASHIPLATLHRNLTGNPDEFKHKHLLAIAGALDLRLSSLIRLTEKAA